MSAPVTVWVEPPLSKWVPAWLTGLHTSAASAMRAAKRPRDASDPSEQRIWGPYANGTQQTGVKRIWFVVDRRDEFKGWGGVSLQRVAGWLRFDAVRLGGRT